MAQPKSSSGLSGGMGLHATIQHAGCTICVSTAQASCRALYCGCWCPLLGAGVRHRFQLGMRLKVSREGSRAWPATKLTVRALSLRDHVLCRLCKSLRCSKQEAWQFMQSWARSAEGQKWVDAAAGGLKKASAGGSTTVAMTERKKNEIELPLLATASDSDEVEKTN